MWRMLNKYCSNVFVVCIRLAMPVALRCVFVAAGWLWLLPHFLTITFHIVLCVLYTLYVKINVCFTYIWQLRQNIYHLCRNNFPSLSQVHKKPICKRKRDNRFSRVCIMYISPKLSRARKVCNIYVLLSVLPAIFLKR